MSDKLQRSTQRLLDHLDDRDGVSVNYWHKHWGATRIVVKCQTMPGRLLSAINNGQVKLTEVACEGQVIRIGLRDYHEDDSADDETLTLDD